MRVITIANQKGGVGKTSLTTSFAQELIAKGYKVLLVDCDKQGSSSDSYQAEIEGQSTLYDVLLDDSRIPVSDAIQHTSVGDIIASDPLLRESEAKMSVDPDGDFRLADALDSLKGYDFVIIDTPPDINHMLYNALIAADEVIIPVTADRYSLLGLSNLYEVISKIQKRQNPKLKIAGILMVKYNRRTRLAQATKESLEKNAKGMSTKLFDTAIRESTKVKEAQTYRMPLLKYAPNCTARQDYLSFTNEYLKGVKKNGKKQSK